jgi:hypothetical protein
MGARQPAPHGAERPLQGSADWPTIGSHGSTAVIDFGAGALVEGGGAEDFAAFTQDAGQPLMSAVSASANKAGSSAVPSRSTVRNSRPSRAPPSNAPPQVVELADAIIGAVKLMTRLSASHYSESEYSNAILSSWVKSTT